MDLVQNAATAAAAASALKLYHCALACRVCQTMAKGSIARTQAFDDNKAQE